jgi:serine/threonine protein phosphatase 1
MISLKRRTHRLPRNTDFGGRPLYAVGDVHGCYDLLHALLGEISFDSAQRYPAETPLLILCGDYIDRGPASSKVLAALVWLTRSSAINTRLLEGNHEAVFRQFLENPEDFAKWLAFGGRETIESYGVSVPEAAEDGAVLTALRDNLLDVMPVSHHDLFRRFEKIVEVGEYAFVHAGVMPGVPLKSQSDDDLLWIRGEFLEHPRPSTSIIVHGHTWFDEQPDILPHRIGIDTGAYETGVLTGMHFMGDAVEVIQAVREHRVAGIDRTQHA